MELWVYSKPYGQAQSGGDVYYASSCATGRISRLLLADVAGHGNAVAATAADLRTLRRRFVNRLDQGEFVRLLNQQFVSLSRAGGFATAIVATFFEPSRALRSATPVIPGPFSTGQPSDNGSSWATTERRANRDLPTYHWDSWTYRSTSSLTLSWNPAIACSATPMR